MSAITPIFFACTRAVSERFTTRNDQKKQLEPTKDDTEKGLTGTV